MDGTLVDTEPYWIDTEYALADKYGGTWSHEHAMNLVGSALLDSGAYIRLHMGIDRTPHQIVDELLDGVVARVEDEVPWRPGARELLADLHANDIPCALVTMSWQRFVHPILRHLPDGVFASVVTGDRVEFGKPHPEPYLTAAAELGLAPAECVAIEDSDTGARSAVAAGCTTALRAAPRADPGGRGAGLRREPPRRRRGRSRASGRGVRRTLRTAEHVMRP